MEKFILLPVAQGTEEMEAVVVIDLLRRAKLNVKVAGENELVSCAHGLKIVPDIMIANLDIDDEFDAIILPGGTEGTRRLTENDTLEKILKLHNKKGKLLAAICAAPTILLHHNILVPGSPVTSHPGVKFQFEAFEYKEDKVVQSGNIITSRGAGTVIDFALSIIENLINSAAAEKVADSILYK